MLGGLTAKKPSACLRKCEKASFLIIKKNLQVSACMCAVISVLWKWMYLPKKADVDLNVFEKITGICFEKDIVWKEIK